MSLSKFSGLLEIRSYRVYLEKTSAFVDLLKKYEVGIRDDTGRVEAAAKMVGLKLTKNTFSRS